MNPIVTRQLVSACSIVLLAAFLSACGSNPVTPTVREQPTIATTSTHAAPATTTFQQLTCSHFTIRYPTNCKTSHVSQPGHGQTADHHVDSGAVVTDLIHANNAYFKPMLASFKFND